MSTNDQEAGRKPAWDSTIKEFLEEAGAAKPTPGGGSVAALVGALGAAMASMAANFTKGAKYADVADEVESVLARLREMSMMCEDLLEADIVSFERYMAAIRLPKDTDEQKAARRHAIEEASHEAVAIPLRLMEACAEALGIACELAPYANKNVISDLGIGAVLFEAAAESALLTVEINLAAMSPSERRDEYDRASREWMSRIAERKVAAVDAVRKRIRE